MQRKRQCTHRSILREIKWDIFCRNKIKGPQLFGFGIPMLIFEIWKTCHQENKLKGYTYTSSTEPPANSLQKTRDCLQSDIFAGTQTKYLGSEVPVVLLCLPVKLMLMNSSKEFTTFSSFQYSQNRFPQLFSPKSKKAETPLLSWLFFCLIRTVNSLQKIIRSWTKVTAELLNYWELLTVDNWYFRNTFFLVRISLRP